MKPATPETFRRYAVVDSTDLEAAARAIAADRDKKCHTDGILGDQVGEVERQGVA